MMTAPAPTRTGGGSGPFFAKIGNVSRNHASASLMGGIVAGSGRAGRAALWRRGAGVLAGVSGSRGVVGAAGSDRGSAGGAGGSGGNMTGRALRTGAATVATGSVKLTPWLRRAFARSAFDPFKVKVAISEVPCS